MNSKKIAATALILGVSAALGSCSDVDKIVNQVDNKNYSEALEAFKSSDLSDSDSEKLCEQMKKRIDDSLAAYAEGKADESDVSEIISTAYNMNIGDLLAYVAVARKELNELSVSKQAFGMGIDYYNQEYYAQAYQAFGKVVEKDANYSEAASYLSKCVQSYCDKVKQTVNGYVVNNNYDGAISYLNSIRSESSFSDEAQIYVETTTEELIVPSVISKAKEYASQDNYSYAFSTISDARIRYNIISNNDLDSYETELIAEYRESINSQVADYISAKSFDDAVNYLQKAKQNVSNINSLVKFIEDTIDSVRIQSVLSQAKESVAENDIATALTTISEFKNEYGVENNKELDEYVDSISQDYIDMILSRVAKLREEENYILALNILSNASKIIECDEFKTQIDEINAIKPTYLYDLKYSTSNRFEIKDTGEALEDTIGNKYDVGNLFEISSRNGGWGENDNGSVDYNLGYRFTSLSGRIAVDDISSNVTATLKITGDDVLLYSIDVGRNMTPTPIKINVSNVNWLNISLVDPSDEEIYVILSDFMLSKDEGSAPQTTTTTSEVAASTDSNG